MRARDILEDHPTIRADEPAAGAAELLSRGDVRTILVVGSFEEFVGVLSDAMLLEELLPSYIEEAKALASVLEEAAADALRQRLEGRTAGDLLPQAPEEAPIVGPDDNLIEVASVMARAGTRLVAVVEKGKLLGGISRDRLLEQLLRKR